MNWNDFAKEVHQVAVDHGWWDKPVSFDDVICMCICELAEAVEEWRDGKPNLYYPCNAGGLCEDDKTEGAMDCGSRVIDPDHPEIRCKAKSKEPHGVAVELADCVLRLLDYMATTNMDINKAFLEVKAEVKAEDVTDQVETVVLDSAACLLSVRWINPPTAFEPLRNNGLMSVIVYIDLWARANHIDLEAILRAKNEYNKTRPFRHGGKRL